MCIRDSLTTVQRTEVALQSRRARRAASGGISDGDKVKLQLYLDFQEFCRQMEELGVDSSSVEAISRLKLLTEEAGSLMKTQNGSS